MAVPTDFILKDDVHVRKLVKEMTEAERSLKRMRNELEVERVKGKLAVTEWKGEILKLEELVSVSMSKENNRLTNLMINQLTEINKKDVLTNIYCELLKQREAFVKELPSDLNKPNEPVNSNERPLEICLPNEGEDETKIEDHILRTEEKIVETEKQQVNLKSSPAQRHELLDELLILEKFTKMSEEPPLLEVPESNTPTSGAQFEILEEDNNCDESNNSSNLSRNCASEGMAAFPSEERIVGNTGENYEIRKGTCYGPYDATGKNSAFVLKTAKRMNRVGVSREAGKRSKLDLYEMSGRTGKELTDPKSEEASGMKKSAPIFKPKIPSGLRLK